MKKLFLTFGPKGYNKATYSLDELGVIKDIVDGAEAGEEFEGKLIEMTETEFEELPEYEGP